MLSRDGAVVVRQALDRYQYVYRLVNNTQVTDTWALMSPVQCGRHGVTRGADADAAAGGHDGDEFRGHGGAAVCAGGFRPCDCDEELRALVAEQPWYCARSLLCH